MASSTQVSDDKPQVPLDPGTSHVSSDHQPSTREKTSRPIASDLASARIVPPETIIGLWLSQAMRPAASGKVSVLLPTLYNKILQKLRACSDKRSKLPEGHRFTTQKMLNHLTTFIKQSADKEVKSYDSWIWLSNCALDIVRNIQITDLSSGGKQFRDYRDGQNEVVMIRNDPSNIFYTHNKVDVHRKPDTVLVSLSAALQHIKKSQDVGHGWVEFVEGDLNLKFGRSELDSKGWNWIMIKLACEFKTSPGAAPDQAFLTHITDTFETRNPWDLVNIATERPNLPFVEKVTRPWEFTEVPTPTKATTNPLRVRFSLIEEEAVTETVIEQVAAPPVPEPEPMRRLRHTQVAQPATQDSSELSKEGGTGPGLSRAVAQDTSVHGEPLPTQDKDNIHLQLAEYLLAKLCSSSGQKCAHGLAIEGRTVYAMMVDREGFIISEGFNIVRYMPLYMALLFAFQRLGDSEWGMHPLLDPKTLQLDGTEYTRTDLVLHKPWGLLGRMSTVRQYTYQKDGVTYNAAVKTSWPRVDQQDEGDTLKVAYEKLCGAKKDPSVYGHIPRVLAAARYDETKTDIIRKFMGCESQRPRELSILITPQYQGTIKALYRHQYENVLLDCLHAHYTLWQIGIHHGDISDTNLLYRFLSPEEKVLYKKANPLGDPDQVVTGVLCDFDLTVKREPKNEEPTGSRLFRAARLMNGLGHRKGIPQHEYLDDLESFMWVIVIDTAMFPKNERLASFWLTSVYREWGTTTPTPMLGMQKAAWLVHPNSLESHHTTKQHEETWDGLSWLVKLVRQFRNPLAENEGENVVDGGGSDHDTAAEAYYKQIVEGEKREAKRRIAEASW